MAECELHGQGLDAKIIFRLEQDIAGNRSLVHITKVEVKLPFAANYGGSWMTGSISMDGRTAAELWLNNTQSCGVYLSGEYFGGGEGTWSGFRSQDIVVEHLADGSGQLRVRAVLHLRITSGGNIEPGAMEGIFTLPTIPRVSQIGAAVCELGGEMVIHLSRAAERFRDTVDWRCGGESGTLAEKTQLTGLRWVPPVALASQAPNRQTAPVVLRVTSYDGDTAVGSREVTVLCPIPAGIVPAVEFTVDDPRGYADSFGGYVRSQSRARVTVQAAGAYGSWITEIRAECGGLTARGAQTVFALEDSGRVEIRVTVTDSRGRQTAAQKEITVLPYERPGAVIRSAGRCDELGVSQPDGNYLRLEFDGWVSPLAGNTAQFRALRQVHGSDGVSQTVLSQYSGSLRVEGGSVILAAGVDNGYDCAIMVQDSFGQGMSDWVLVPVAFILMDFARSSRAVGIGMRARTAEAVSFGLDADFCEHRIRGLAEPVADTDGATKGYVDAMIARAIGK